MIIARSPLRITLGGGGTDLPSYYEKHGGFLMAAAIDQYVYVTVHRNFLEHTLIRYSKIEQVKDRSEIQHPIIREALKDLGITDKNIEITSMADIPAGTGLGSSGSFTTALIKALVKFKRGFIEPRGLAEAACRIELDLLKEPIGKQDQFIAAYGGITCFDFQKDGTVRVEPLQLAPETFRALETQLLLFSTGFTRSASAILKEQDDQTRASDSAMVDNLHFVKDLGLQSKAALEQGDLRRFGELMHVHWEHKKKRSKSMSTGRIDEWYEHARKNGAVGGKLIGAGGGGFLMFYTEDTHRLRAAMRDVGLTELGFHFDFEGTKLL